MLHRTVSLTQLTAVNSTVGEKSLHAFSMALIRPIISSPSRVIKVGQPSGQSSAVVCVPLADTASTARNLFAHRNSVPDPNTRLEYAGGDAMYFGDVSPIYVDWHVEYGLRL